MNSKKMFAHSEAEEQYKKMLQLMLELENKIEGKNVELLSDLTRELQKLANKQPDTTQFTL